MIDEGQLQELAGFESKGSPVLSLYLSTDLTQQPKEKCRLVLRDLLAKISPSVPDADVLRVESFFDQDYDWQARGVAIFSHAEGKYWRVFTLAVPVQDEVYAGMRFYLMPLSQALDEHLRYGVVLVSRESARFFLGQMGQITEMSPWVGEDLKRHKQGGWASTRYQRRADQQAGQNLKLIAEQATRFCKENHCNRLVVAGADETIAQFREILPKAMQKQVVGTLTLDMEASVVQVRDRSAELIQGKERERERQLVEDMVTAAAKGGGAVIGVADTFYVAHEGRVHTLVVEKGFESEGYLCGGCGFISAQPMNTCSLCGDEPEKIADAVDRIVRRVIATGGRVETVVGNEALAQAGHIGAILRYK